MNTTGKTILVGLDGSLSAWRAQDWAAEEAHRTGSHVVLAHAGDGSPAKSGDGSFGRELLADALARLIDNDYDLEVRTVLREGNPADLLLELADDAQLVVLGRGHHRARALRLGSVADKVLAHAPGPVVIVDDTQRTPTNTIVVGTSNSVSGLAAMDFACALARRRGAAVLAVRSWSDRDWRLAAATALPLSSPDIWRAQEQAVLESCVQRARHAFPSVSVRSTLTGEPVEVALEQASHDAALLVLGCRREEGTPLPRMGPVTSWAAHHFRCPVAVVPRPADVPEPDVAAEPAVPAR